MYNKKAQISITPRRGQSFKDTALYAINMAKYLNIGVLLIFRTKRIMVRSTDTLAAIARR
jgi:hypothetical protein